ncbi:reverse transcriptase family protein [Devosia sp. XJ19-1]|uniref:Reverse transcriptase family protein n=1 Tax=Devosia ureilytica TaxID=2952754 RepID=A0A9Q4ANI2_9HYPH|nr:reverse transcriptase family protein [Devosia ureilytica]MCP8886817.1 reverse transcriptase family protein [Devosia ureilytica]
MNYKENFIVRREVKTGKKGKIRQLAYPESRLRGVHERLKFHLNKIKQPSYLFSPRKNRSQRDNAAHHLGQRQFLTLDLKQFYPSTTDRMVKRWFVEELNMYEDVAGLLTHLVTVDGKVSFGSPLTPVLCSLVHRGMFDEIASLCDTQGLMYSVWVDDLTISGQFVPGSLLTSVREIVRRHGLKSHDVKYRLGNRPVFITGVGVVGSNLVAPNSLHLRIREHWEQYHRAVSRDEKDAMSLRLLSLLGTLRYVAGPSSTSGKKAADQMNSLRQERNLRQRAAEIRYFELTLKRSLRSETENVDAPF